ncbi:Uncharacterized protein dnm_075960 [Desulfonema magnum]|uniref:Uncharacterized protein n=1 Tax=Desulfonema magnum TaxID=45655 RepID=A0A975GS42_9BACT|nr:Uncharacterized protein dnm_075960 [Desulfonema magnum]
MNHCFHGPHHFSSFLSIRSKVFYTSFFSVNSGENRLFSVTGGGSFR